MAEKKEVKMPNLSARPEKMSRLVALEKPKNARSTVRRLLGIYASSGSMLVFSVLMIIGAALLTLLTPLIMGRAVDCFDLETGNVKTDLLFSLVLALAAAYALSTVLMSFSGFLTSSVSQKLVAEMRRRLFARLQSLPLLFFDTTAHGDLMSRLTSDTDNISEIIAQATTQLLTAAITIGGTVFCMLALSPVLTLAAFLTLPLIIFITRFISGRTRRYFYQNQRTLGALNGLMEETVSASALVKAFCRQDALVKEFDGLNAELVRWGTRAHLWSGFLMPMMNVIDNLSYAFLALAGGFLAVKGFVSVGVITAFVTYQRQMSRPLSDIAGMVNSLQSALAGAERVFEVIDQQGEREDAPGALTAENIQGKVEFRNVSFAYETGKPVLKDVSFSVSPGETIAIVGPTGAGKTTVVNLLTRFYERGAGEILIDGVDIEQYTRQSLRRCFSAVLQDACFFTGTIFENIRYARPDASDTEIIDAARAAGAHGFISRLPQGYGTVIKGGASSLSQGQRQMLSIARAFLCEGSILILDEATSSVDTRTELRIQKAMLRLMEGRTAFLIAHRLSTIRGADRIFVIDGGRLVESGSHETLLARGGLYARMYRSQVLDNK